MSGSNSPTRPNDEIPEEEIKGNEICLAKDLPPPEGKEERRWFTRGVFKSLRSSRQKDKPKEIQGKELTKTGEGTLQQAGPTAGTSGETSQVKKPISKMVFQATPRPPKKIPMIQVRVKGQLTIRLNQPITQYWDLIRESLVMTDLPGGPLKSSNIHRAIFAFCVYHLEPFEECTDNSVWVCQVDTRLKIYTDLPEIPDCESNWKFETPKDERDTGYCEYQMKITNSKTGFKFFKPFYNQPGYGGVDPDDFQTLWATYGINARYEKNVDDYFFRIGK